MSKFRLFGRDKLQDHTCLMKEKERRKRKSEEEEKRRRRKSKGGALSFYNGYFGEKKNSWTQKVHFAVTFSKIRLDIDKAHKQD